MQSKKKAHLPRFDRDAYTGQKHVMFDMRTRDSARVFVRRDATEGAIALLCTYVERYSCAALCYVFMPDHAHLILLGLADSSDILQCHDVWKAQAAIRLKDILELQSEHVFQKQSYDHVMRSWEYERHRLFRKVQYIVMNPVRARLVEQWQDYPYVGSTIGEYDIRHPFWWDDAFGVTRQ